MAPQPNLIVTLHLEDAAVVGLIIAPALVNKLHRKGVIMFQPQVAAAAGTLILLPVLAVSLRLPAHQEARQLPQALPQAAPVLPDLTG